MEVVGFLGFVVYCEDEGVVVGGLFDVVVYLFVVVG